jgi:outer membrane protein assembly factor BamB
MNTALLFGDQAGTLTIFDTGRGTVTWSYNGPAAADARPCVMDGKLLFATVRGDFFFMEMMP